MPLIAVLTPETAGNPAAAASPVAWCGRVAEEVNPLHAAAAAACLLQGALRRITAEGSMDSGSGAGSAGQRALQRRPASLGALVQLASAFRPLQRPKTSAAILLYLLGLGFMFGWRAPAASPQQLAAFQSKLQEVGAAHLGCRGRPTAAGGGSPPLSRGCEGGGIISQLPAYLCCTLSHAVPPLLPPLATSPAATDGRHPHPPLHRATQPPLLPAAARCAATSCAGPGGGGAAAHLCCIPCFPRFSSSRAARCAAASCAQADAVVARLSDAEGARIELEVDLAGSKGWFWRFSREQREEVAAKMPAVQAARDRVAVLGRERDRLVGGAGWGGAAGWGGGAWEVAATELP